MAVSCSPKTFCRQLFREVLSEFIGTFVLVFITVGTAAQAGLSRGSHGSPLSTAFCSGIAVMMAVHVSGKTSGGHVNPAVSFAMACIGKFSWLKVPFYMLAQYCGAFVAASMVFAVYVGARYDYTGSHPDMAMAAMWTSFPSSFLSFGYSFFDATVSAALLMLMNLAVTDKKNMGFWSGFSPFFLGLIVTTIGMGFSLNASNPMNPARDLGPRLFLSISGWGDSVFRGPHYTWWWIPVVAPHLGTLIGGLIYEVFIEFHHPEEEPSEQIFLQDKLSIHNQDTPHETELLISATKTSSMKMASFEHRASSVTL